MEGGDVGGAGEHMAWMLLPRRGLVVGVLLFAFWVRTPCINKTLGQSVEGGGGGEQGSCANIVKVTQKK